MAAATITSSVRIEDGDARVVDFLDDKLQALEDLDHLDALLHTVRGQQVLLRKQLHDAEADKESATRVARDHQASVRTEAETFTHHQRDIDRRLRIITESEASDDAVQRFENSMDRLHRLDIADGYVRQLHDIDNLRDQCLASLGKSDPTALDAYHRIHKLAANVPALQEAAEGAAPHLVDHILDTTKLLRTRIEQVFSRQFEDVLKQMKWPAPDQTIPSNLEGPFRDCVRRLLDLQRPDLENACNSQGATREPPLVLLPLQVMVRPMELVFRYHFESDKPTNRLDRPEYFLHHITDKLLGQYAEFMIDHLQALLSEEFRASSISLNAAYTDATSAFVTALLPMVRNKISAILPKVAQKPQLLSHLIHQIMTFDVTLREEWSYDGGNNDGSWRGLTYEVLSTGDWFPIWLNVEKEYAIARYEKIVEAPDASELDYDGIPSGVTKPTKAAIRVNDLLEATTDNYRTLTSFSQKLRFLMDIQIAIFDRYHNRLEDHRNAYQIRNTRIGRTSKEEQLALQGIQGLETLCKIYGSAEYLEKAMRDWSDDVFFLDLWTELQERVPRSKSTHITRDGLTLAQVAEVTSSTLGTDDAADNGAMFDETAASYQKLRIRCEALITDLINNQIRKALEPYTRINPWASLSDGSSASQTTTTAELDPLFAILKQDLGFLKAAMGKLPLSKLVRAAAKTVDDILFDRVLVAHSFSGAGAAQLLADIAALRRAFAEYNAVDAEVVLGKSSEGARLVGLPIRGNKAAARASVEDDYDHDDDGDAGRRELGLWEVEKRLFQATGEVARQCLEELGMQRLAVHEARKVLARRVELGS